MRSSSASSATSSDEDDDTEEDGWSGFKWNFDRMNWQMGSNHPLNSIADARSGYVPSPVDFERNFEEENGDEEDDSEDDNDFPLAEDTLYPGLYRALYAFEPEGSAEMSLEEDQIVRVIGRGGGVGWAVVSKEGGAHALVPESYLEVYKLDGEDWEEDQGPLSSEVKS